MIYDRAALDSRFANSARTAAVLDDLTDRLGAVPIADYAWAVTAEGTTVRHLRRVTPIGLIALREEGTAEAPAMRMQIVTIQQATAIAIVRYESPEGSFWEMHVGDGNPRPVPESELDAAFDFVRAALEATANLG